MCRATQINSFKASFSFSLSCAFEKVSLKNVSRPRLPETNFHFNKLPAAGSTNHQIALAQNKRSLLAGKVTNKSIFLSANSLLK